MSARWVPLFCCALLACRSELVTVGYGDGTGATAGKPAAAADAGAAHSGALSVRIVIETSPATGDAGSSARCSPGCFEVAAAVSGGRPPYSFSWSDGAREERRRICSNADLVLGVVVRDTPVAEDEARSGSAALTLEVPSCCAFSEEATVDVQGDLNDLVGLQFAPVTWFADGASLPAGRYRAEYVDGCFTCCITLLDRLALVGPDHTQVQVLPGGDAIGVEPPGVASCPVRGAPYPALDFDFPGGPLGVWLSDHIAADNWNGDGASGRSPTWRLTRLDLCQ